MAVFTDDELEELIDDLNELGDRSDHDYEVLSKVGGDDDELAMLLITYRDEAEALLLALIDDGRVMTAFNRFR